MDVSRRDFLKISGATVGLSSLSLDPTPVNAEVPRLRIENAKETTTVCPYCSVGCSILVYAKDGKVIQTEGILRARSTKERSVQKGPLSGS